MHSGVTDSGEWDAVRPLLAREHEVVTPDLPGFGSEPERPGEFSLGDYVLGTFDGSAALVGTSFGGRAVLEAALAAPERVTKLVLIGANVFGWSEDVQRVQQEEEALFDDGRLDDAAELMARSWLAGPQRQPDDVDARALRARVRDGQARLRASSRRRGFAQARGDRPVAHRKPTLVVRGELDWPDVATAAERFVRELPDAREEVVAGCAHLPTMERPDEVARLILEFLRN